MSIEVRPAKPEDAARLAYVQVESWKSTYSGIVPDAFLAAMDIAARTEVWSHLLSDGDILTFAAEDEVGVFGFVSGGKLREQIDGYDGELYAIYLLSRKQHQGVGTQLVRTLAHDLDKRGFKGLLLWVLEQNPFIGFYKKLGGEYVARKSVAIGGVDLPEIALGWTSLKTLLVDSH